MSVRAEPRFTRDADIVVSVSGDAYSEADDASLHEAGAALALITRRGFHRGRDLAGALAAARQELGPRH